MKGDTKRAVLKQGFALCLDRIMATPLKPLFVSLENSAGKTKAAYTGGLSLEVSSGFEPLYEVLQTSA